MNIYVGNLPYSMDDQTLEDLFSEYGEVERASVIIDRETGRSRGFGFVEMSDDEAAKQAIANLDQHDCDGRALRVNEARPKPRREGGGFRSRSGYGR